MLRLERAVCASNCFANDIFTTVCIWSEFEILQGRCEKYGMTIDCI